jgi:signal transduction histidine kinase
MRAPRLELPGGFSGRVAQPRRPEERQRVEQIFAVARLFLGVAAVATVYAAPLVALSPPAPAVRLLFLLYALHAGVIVAVLRLTEPPPSALIGIIHGADLIWAAILTTMTSGVASPFFMLFLFALLGAAYRWGFRETLATGAAALAIVGFEAVRPRAWAPVDAWQIVQADPHTLVMRGAYLLMGAVILGYIGEEERLRSAKVAIGTALLAAAQSQIGFRNALRRVAGELLCDFEADALVITVHTERGRTVTWHADHGCAPGGARTALRAERPRIVGDAALDGRGDAWRVRRRRSSIDVDTLDDHGGIVATSTASTPEAFWPAAAHRCAVVIALRFADEWNGRAALFFRRVPCVAETRVMQNVVCDIAPVMFNQYLLRRLRSRVAAAERTRLARELHDGVIQALAGLEMQVAALRRAKGAAIAQAGIDGDLQRVQGQLAEEARSARDMMNEIRPLDIPRGQVNEAFAELVERFGRENDLHSRFTAITPGVVMSGSVARELGRTLQEALHNVRKHADATRVDVTFGADNGHWKLVVSNDGRPFDFTGYRTLADLDAAHQGPRMIKERVREIGGDLAINSSPDRGVTLEVRVPRVVDTDSGWPSRSHA